jgi:transcriptional regulator with XRE-family HTH domain
MNLIGPQVRRLRVQQALSQPALATRCQLTGYNISREGLAKIESRLRGVSDAEVVLLARALKVPFVVLYPAENELETLVAAFSAS